MGPSSYDDDEVEEGIDMAWGSPLGVGTITPLMERPNKGRQKFYRRPIGFMANIDELYEVED